MNELTTSIDAVVLAAGKGTRMQSDLPKVLHEIANRPLLGPVDEVAGLLVATGLKSTIILTPFTGVLLADMVTGREVDPRLVEFSPSRDFAGT